MTRQYPSFNFTTEQEAIDRLILSKEEPCRGQLLDHYYLGRNLGLDFDDAFDRALLLHHHLDHENARTPDDFTLTTDEEAMQIIEESLRIAGAEDMIVESLDMYETYRSWGMTIFYAGQSVLSNVYERQRMHDWDAMDRMFYDELKDVPGADPAIKVYKAAREDGMDPRSAKTLAHAAAFHAGEPGYELNPFLGLAAGKRWTIKQVDHLRRN